MFLLITLTQFQNRRIAFCELKNIQTFQLQNPTATNTRSTYLGVFHSFQVFYFYFYLCMYISELLERPTEEPSGNPCVPSPCGPNSQCRAIGNTPACSCVSNYIGRPPNCRPECVINAECPGNLACQNEKCQDPCPGSCGIHATCRVVKHTPVCTCIPGYTGDPFAGCSLCKNISPSSYFSYYFTSKYLFPKIFQMFNQSQKI